MPDPHNAQPAPSKRWPAVVSIALLLTVSLAAGASAQLDTGDVPAPPDTGDVPAPPDTFATPVANDDATAWIQVGGAEYGIDGFPDASFTPVETEFYSVAFENDLHGFAGGSRCKVAPPAALKDDALTTYLRDCPREPVIYEYVKGETEESWHPVLPPAGDGYVGAIAFMPGGRALAVGGDGVYPKRETEAITDVENDIAGNARAWLFDGTVWVEITDGRMMQGMRGLTAVAMSQKAGDCAGDPAECGLAGGYRQMWLWRNGRFVDGWDTAPADRSPDAHLTVHATTTDDDDSESFRFRVRQIGFVAEGNATKAVAVTSGCCDANPARNVPAGLVFDGENLWAKEFGSPTVVAGVDDPSVRRDTPDSLYGFVESALGQFSVVASPGGPPNGNPEGRGRVLQSQIPQPTATEGTNFFLPTGQDDNAKVALSNARLTAAAGTTRTSNLPLWAVGSHVGGTADDAQAIAYAPRADTGPGQALQVTVLTCPGGGYGISSLTARRPPDPACKPYEVPGGYLGQIASKYLYALPSYGLNAFAFTDDTNSIGWAVGDRGALMRLGGIGTTSGAGGAPTPARLGASSIARLSGSDVYDAFRPLPTDGEVGPVPSLASNGTHEVARPRLVPAGSPNPTIRAHPSYPPEDVATVVMSQDGSEGWALGSGWVSLTDQLLPGAAPAPTLYHYDGLRWSRCDIKGVPDLLPADPACSELDELFGQGVIGETNVILRYAVRVPTEEDEDPSNDGFEVFAIGSEWNGKGGQTPLRYRDGHWSVDKEALEFFSSEGLLEVRSVAFTAPNDGWVLDEQGGNLHLYHWDDETWFKCEDDRQKCGDVNSRLPLNVGGTGALTTAGERVYLAAARSSTQASYPVILYKDPGGAWTAVKGGYDPACADEAQPCNPNQTQAPPEQRGKIISIAVSPDLQNGWAVGTFGDGRQTLAGGAGAVGDLGTSGEEAIAGPYYLLRLSGGVWTPWRRDDASMDYLGIKQGSGKEPLSSRMPKPVILDADGTAAISTIDNTVQGPSAFMFDPKRERWGVMRTPYHNYGGVNEFESGGLTRAVVPDGADGAWLAGRQVQSPKERPSVHFWHYTRTVPNPVFEEAPHPIRESITGGAAGKDGSLWVTTNSGFVYRYDRLTGWDRLRIPGWDPGRVVTRTSEANAVAVGPDGEGVVVGKNGRMAQVSALGVQLDPAAREVCGDPPCGTARDLRAVDIAPDGSALVGGDASVLLYRPPGGEFRTIDFGGSPNTSITAISLPTTDRAWLTNAAGQVYAGRREGDKWTFFVENRAASRDLLSRDENKALLALNGIEIDQSGEGYAVGERGLLLERRGDGGWQRLKTGFLDNLRSVTLAPGGRAQGALIGGDMGLVLTLEDGEFRAAREADLFDPLNYGRGGNRARVLGVAMVPGLNDGEVEAWAVQQSAQGPGAVLHYASNDQPLLRPGGRIEPLPDVPEPREAEISFAAFGRSECHVAPDDRCGEGGEGNLFHQVVADRVADAITERSKEPGGPAFAVFTGDVGRAAGSAVNGQTRGLNTSLDRSVVHNRWKEQIASRFEDAGVPLYGAVGRNDLDRNAPCPLGGTVCPVDAKRDANTGLTWGWRKSMADMPPPWGAPSEDGPGEASTDAYSFKAVADEGPAGGDALGKEDPVLAQFGPQARTHYAIDLQRSGGGASAARLIFLDNSMGTLSSSDPNQNPIEPDGQLRWLERMLEGARENGQQAIVVMNRPTYSYQVSDATTWATDGTALEQTLMRYGVKLVVSGRLGWNGRYWATTPGVHSPCIGEDYKGDDEAPEPGERPCTQQANTDQVDQATEQLAGALQGLGPPPPPGEGEVAPLPDPGVLPDPGLQGLIPMVVASSAGGQFGPNGTDGGEAGDGWWHGYTIVRMDASGDPRKTIVEQRPVFDWLSITAPSHLLKPRQRMTLIGEGREPVGADVAPRFDRVNSNAITHRYDLVLADEKNPSLPARDANGEYTEVDDCTNVGCIDRESGVVTAGNGRHERIYAVAILSVGNKAASWPVAFEQAKSYEPVASVSQRPAAAPNQVPRPPATVVLNQGPAPTPPPPPPPSLPQINVPPLNLPAPPLPPNLPTPTATPTPTPPPPPPPPPPPGSAGALPLSLEAPITPIAIVPTVIPPTPPPVNPAPPSGGAARKEARQRQAATAKSEEGGGEQQGAGEGQSSGENGAAQMTRRDPTRPAPSYGESSRDDRRYSFTALSHTEQASAWSRGALYGGMTLATALALALGWGIARPTPRRRHPPRPAPETVRDVGRRPRS